MWNIFFKTLKSKKDNPIKNQVKDLNRHFTKEYI